MQIQWTDERPTEPGEYWLSFQPVDRGRWGSSSVKYVTIVGGTDSLHVTWLDSDGHCRLLPLNGHQFNGALWSVRETPADPFEVTK